MQGGLPSRPSLAIIIVNWNSGEQLRACLDSLFAADASNFALQSVVVVDNASTDGSVQGLDERVLLLRNANNVGFAKACNQGARVAQLHAQADYLLFLNPDTVLQADSLQRPIAFMQLPSNADIGICGIQLRDADGAISRSCARFPSLRTMAHHMLGLDRVLPHRFPSHFMFDFPHTSSQCVDHVIGAFFLVRQSLFEQLRGFDEDFFLYWEDLDFSLRAQQAGFRSFYLAEVSALHKGGGCSEQIRARRLFLSLKHRLIYCRKHFSRRDQKLVLFGTFFLEWPIRMAHALLRGQWQQATQTLRAYVWLAKDCWQP